MTLATAVLSNPLVRMVLRVLGLALLAGTVTAVVSFVYRARVRTQFPEGATLIVGLGVVAISLNTRLVFVQFVGTGGDLLSVSEALLNVVVFFVAGIASYGGRYAGNKLGASGRLSWKWLQPDFAPIVRATGRFITVTIPEDIDDITGYAAVQEETKTALAGRALDFPRGLTVEELQSQLSDRLKEAHNIGYVDVELTTEGDIEYLAVGQRPAGLGPTLPPNSAAVAVRADPPFSATAGDTVQLWHSSDGTEERLGTGELRASAGAVVTLAVDEDVAASVDPTVDHRLMTLSADSYPDREFAAMLRRGDETMHLVEVSAESPLVGTSVGALDVTVIAIRTPAGEVNTIPKRGHVLQAGDCLFAIGRPELLRKLVAVQGTLTIGGDPIPSATSAGFKPESADVGEPGRPGGE